MTVPSTALPDAFPHPRTRLIGREAERTTAQEMLLEAGTPLLTLAGPGGVGKTRLALAIAVDVADHFADGVVWVELASLADPALVASTVARVLGLVIPPDQTATDSLIHALRRRQTLVVLDNCEHLRDAVGDLLSTLLAACPALQALATSRATLHVRGECRMPIEPLPLPPAQPAGSIDALARNPTVALFVERSRSARSDFQLTDADAPAVTTICHRLDGLPLAIELAAARSPLLSPTALAAHLDDRLDLLRDGPRDLPARQQTMRDAIAWSYDLLESEDQGVFVRLAIFAGGWTLPAFAAVTGLAGAAAIERLGRLEQHSLIRSVESTDEPRFAMLETIRAYGLERLTAMGLESETRDRHAAWVVAAVEQAWPPRSPAPADVAALGRLDREHGNIRAALAWAIAQRDGERALRLASALAEYWWLRGEFSEGRAWLRQALELGGPPAARAALYGAAGLADNQGDQAMALALGEECLALAASYGDALDVLRAHMLLSGLAYGRGDPIPGRTHLAAAIRLARDLGHANWLGYCTIGEAYDALRYGDPDAAVRRFEAASASFVAAGDPWGEMNAAYGLALAAQALDARRRLLAACRRIIEISQRIASPWGTIRGIAGLAPLIVEAGEATVAARVLGAATAHGESMGFLHNREGARLHDNARALAWRQLGDERFAAAWQAGQRMTLAEAAAEAVRTAVMVDQQRAVRDRAAREPERETSAARLLQPDRLHDDPGAASGAEDGRGLDVVEPSPLLTRREREVLRLLCQRLTDREIAERLYISPRTASRHVANIFGKLDVSSRRAAAAQAAARGLV